MQLITAFAAGLVFGLGLIVSGMTDPSKVIGFLDLAGNWDPSLAFVMAGAILVGFFAFRIAGRRPHTLIGTAIRLPDARRIDKRLILGGLVFGAGWGVAGYCPGPALTSLLSGGSKPLIFVGAMVAGMGVFELFERRRSIARRKPA